MKTIPAIICLLAVAAGAPAQQAPATPPARQEPTKAQVEDYGSQLTERLEGRMQRATDLVNEIVKLDKSIQQGISKILGLIGGMTDSNESKTRVARTKRDLIERMKKGIEVYARARATLEEQMRTSANPYTRQDLFKERGVMDDRIDKMVDGVVALAATMDTHEDHDKYIVEAGDSDWWGTDVVYRDNPEFEQNRRASRQTDAAVKEISETLEKAVDRLDRRVRQIDEELRTTNPAPDKKAALEAERKRTEALRLERANQESMLYTRGSTASAQPKQKPGLDEAIRTEKFIDLIVADVRRDFTQMVARYRELRAERDAIANLRARLDQCEEWLKKNP